MPDDEVLAVVWGETGALTPIDNDVSTAERLYAVVGNLVMLAKKRGLDNKYESRLLPRVGTPDAARYQTMNTTVSTVEAGTYAGSELPARAALIEVTSTGTPGFIDLPKAAGWILESHVSNTGDFTIGNGSDGRIYRLFESDKVTGVKELPFVSVVSGSGLPAQIPPNRLRKISWALGIASAIIFVAGATLSAWSGYAMSGARNTLNTTNPSMQYRLISKVASVCSEDLKAFPSGKQAEVCAKLLIGDGTPPLNVTTKKIVWPDPAKAVSVLDDAKSCPTDPSKDGCNTIWRAAIALDQEEAWNASVLGFTQTLSAYLTGTNSPLGSTSILVPFLLLAAGVTGLTLALGLGTKQHIVGVWIDERNRVSLARAQVTLWTIVALAGYAAFALFNIGFADIVATNLENVAVFPKIPASVAIALGIAGASPMISALILPTKDRAGGLALATGDSDNMRSRGMPFFGATSEGLDKRTSPASASIADIFMGEEKADVDTVDVSRLQNVVITVVLVFGFFSILVEQASTISATTILGATSPVFGSLPDLGATFASLLFVSHATYLVAKAHDSSDRTPAVPRER
ncbi:hypothetical protein [Rhizobium sp. BR 314]|uniref:hypothetical protein n=1 Tax=Rhizobium sp. BR 314 TaxID=3040013 RepID=UPI0039BF22E5